jgi:transposase
MMSAHMKFLIGASTSLSFVKAALVKHADRLRQWECYDEDTGLFGLRIPLQWGHESEHPRKKEAVKTKKRSYLHIYYSATRAAEEERSLASLLKACSKELSADNRIEAHQRCYDAWFKRERGGVWAGRTEVIDEARQRFGYFALFTNDASLSSVEALSVYRSKDAVEKAFSDIKTRLDFRTPKVSTEGTLDGKLLVVFISLIIISWLKKKMADSGLSDKWTLQGLIDELDTIERYERVGHRPRILEVTKKQKDIFEALGIEPPVAS